MVPNYTNHLPHWYIIFSSWYWFHSVITWFKLLNVIAFNTLTAPSKYTWGWKFCCNIVMKRTCSQILILNKNVLFIDLIWAQLFMIVIPTLQKLAMVPLITMASKQELRCLSSWKCCPIVKRWKPWEGLTCQDRVSEKEIEGRIKDKANTRKWSGKIIETFILIWRGEAGSCCTRKQNVMNIQVKWKVYIDQWKTLQSL